MQVFFVIILNQALVIVGFGLFGGLGWGGWGLFGFGGLCSIRSRNKCLSSHEPMAALQRGEFSWEQEEEEPDQATVFSHQKLQKHMG